MPWETDQDVARHHKGLSANKSKVWREIANKELSDHGDEARAIKVANAAVDRIKESDGMTHKEIDLLIQEATKHYVDDALSNVHSRLQDALTSEHRSAYDGSDWQDYPQVRHVFGDKDSGHVVYKQGETHHRAPYKMDNGGYSLGTPEQVQLAYVPAIGSVREAFSRAGITWKDDKKEKRIVELVERYISTKERKSIPKEDFAGKGDSFPIVKSEDVRAALDSIGRAGSGNHPPETLKANILAIARRKGLAVPKSDQKGDEKKESAVDFEEFAVFQEAAIDKDGNALIKLISPGTGSMGHYSEPVLKEAAKNKVFAAGTRMFMDHQTAQERAARPEGDLRKWVATTTSDAEYHESGADGPGLYAKARIYSDFVPFIKERAKDIGVSVRAGVIPTGNTVGGVPEVKEMKYALSADFVTRAGRGGKLVELYESYRGTNPGSQRREAAGSEPMTAEEQKRFDLLQESQTADRVRLDRLEEENNRLKADKIVAEALTGSGLPQRGMNRVRMAVLGQESAPLPLPMKDKAIDIEKLKANVTAAVTDEKAYLQEAGITVGPRIVRSLGGVGLVDKDGKEKPADTVLQEAGKVVDNSIDSLMGREKKEKTA